MPRAAYYSVILEKTGVDITQDVTRFSHEDAEDVDNLLTLDIKTNDKNYLEKKSMAEGDLVRFKYGYIGERSSPKYVARIVDITASYAPLITFKIMATDLGILLKKNDSKKVWENKTASEIVQEIADLNGLTAVVEDTTKVYEFMPQAGLTDYKLLKKLATLEDDGSFRFYLRGNQIHFTKIDLKKKSIRTFKYADPSGEVLSFKPSSRETRKRGASRSTVVTSVDPFTGEVVQETVDNASSKDDTKLGDFSIYFNENGEEINRSPSLAIENKEDPNRAGQHINRQVIDSTEASNMANKLKKMAAIEDYTAILTLEGNVDYVADEIVTMNNVSKKDLGNWWVKRATHQITPSGSYTVRLAMNKNAAQKGTPGSDKATNVNKTSGKETGAKKTNVKMILFDETGTRVGEKISG